MKKLLFALRAFKSILKADSYCLITTKGNTFACKGDIKPQDFHHIVNDVWDNLSGQEDTLKQYKELLGVKS